jgi:hypothetical protein
VSLSDRLKRPGGTESPAADTRDYRGDPTDRPAGLTSSTRQAIPTREGNLAHPMLDELADLISQAWAEYDANMAPSAPPNVFVQGGQGRHDRQPSLKVVSAMPPSSETPAIAVQNKAYDASAQRIMRHIDALFTTEKSPPSVVPEVTREPTSDR